MEKFQVYLLVSISHNLIEKFNYKYITYSYESNTKDRKACDW